MVEPGVYLGFDFGYRHIGVAVGQTQTAQARPLRSLKAQNGAPDWHQVRSLLTHWAPVGLVVGKPINMDGTDQPITQAAGRFARRLAGRFAYPVWTAEERLTTQEAKALLFERYGYQGLKKWRVDAYAASLILQSWLKQQ